MATERITPSKILRGHPVIPGDKSISHRSLIFGALSNGETEITNLLESGDVQSTARCLTQLGVEIKKNKNSYLVKGLAGYNFRQSTEILDCGNSGTTMRLLMGVLASQNIKSTLTGDSSLIKRPMKRVSDPLALMGATFDLKDGNFAPLTIRGAKLNGINYELKIASAQIKTAIILAALNAEGTTQVTGEIHSRDHTERMLAHFGVKIKSDKTKVIIKGGQKLKGNKMVVPSDPSTAAFWLAAAALIPGSEVVMENISLNPSRTGFAEVLKRMTVQIKTQVTQMEPEPMGTVQAVYGNLKGVTVKPDEVPSLIDEIPLIAVLATQAHGITIVEGAEELRVKESDRLEAVAQNLRAMGAVIEVRPDGFKIEGPQKLKGTKIESFHDHRIAMAFSIAGLVAQGETEIIDSECVGISYPDFFKTLRELTR
jgi:3-phosphoshikimate 1-carboxyvinyltransferase